MSFRVLGFWVPYLVAVSGLCPAASAAQSQPAAASQPATQPAVIKIDLQVPGTDELGRYYLALPTGWDAQCPAPLVICLHGTNECADDFLKFWAGLDFRIPVVLAVPQSGGLGWADEDVPLIRAMLADLQRRGGFDEQRVLLAGFSAGGTMGMHLLYAEGLSATAVAALANYVPPNLDDDQIERHRGVPVFYAVGLADLNHERMRKGLGRLRGAGVNVHLCRPRIRHRLDATVAQAAVDWAFDRWAENVAERIAVARKEPDEGVACLLLEPLAESPEWFEPAQVQAAERLLKRIELPGRRQMRESRRLLHAGNRLDALDALRHIEADYGASRLGHEARKRRIELESAGRE